MLVFIAEICEEQVHFAILEADNTPSNCSAAVEKQELLTLDDTLGFADGVCTDGHHYAEAWRHDHVLVRMCSAVAVGFDDILV